MMPRPAESTSHKGADIRYHDAPFKIAIYLFSALFTLFHFFLKGMNIFGSNSAGWVLYLNSVCCGGLWFYSFITSCKSRRLFGAITCFILLCVVIIITFIPVNGIRFEMMKDTYEEYAGRAYQKLLSEAPEGIYLPLYEANHPAAVPIDFDSSSYLGKIGYVKGEQGNAIIFEDRYTLFDYWCYVRVFSENTIEDILSTYDVAEIINLGHNWYFVNLF